MFWGKGCELKSTTLRRGRRREGGGRGEEYLKSVSKRTRSYGGGGGGGLTLINLERTHFLNGHHSKVVGFILLH